MCSVTHSWIIAAIVVSRSAAIIFSAFLSLTVSDKKTLKMMAAERETTIAAIIHEWVAEHMQEVDE